MISVRIRRLVIALVISTIALVGPISAQTKKTFNVGYFEAGPYAVHTLLRAEFYKQLEQILPDGYEFRTIPQGFRSAEWKRDICKTMAAELVREKDVDLVIAMGPWVVHDLLEAGFDRPILAMHQFDPEAEGLVDSLRRPIVENLTVHIRPNKIANDLLVLSKLVDVQKLGFLHFPSADEKDLVLEYVEGIGQQLGMEIVTAEGHDIYGTYAFFKTFKMLPDDIDAVYLPPLWGLETKVLSDFFSLISDAGVPAFISEGKVLLEKGAFATNSYYSVISEARFNASKAARIIQGETPADLPVIFRSGSGLGVNEAAARKCGVALPEQVLNDFQVVQAPLPESAPYYGLSDAINRASVQNPGVLAQYDALEATAQEARRAYAELLPHLYATAAVTHLDDNATHNLRNLISNDLYEVSLGLEETLSLETIRSIEVAAKQRDLADLGLQQAQLDLELAVSLAYLNCLRAREIYNVCVKNRSLIEHNLELALGKNRTGSGDTLDIIRLEDERYQSTLRVIDARKDLAVSRVLLNALFNMPGNELFGLDSATFSEDIFFKTEYVLYEKISDRAQREAMTESVLSQALENHPSINQIRTRIDVQDALLSQNTARYLPTLGLRASLNFADRFEDRTSFEEKHRTINVSGFLRLPIFLGTDRIRQRGKLKARLSEMEYRRDDVSLEIMSKVQTGFHQLAAAASKTMPAYQSRKRSEQGLNLVIPAYSTGEVGLVSLLDAQENSLKTDLASIKARYAYYESMARLVHAAGWSTHESYTDFLHEFHQRMGN